MTTLLLILSLLAVEIPGLELTLVEDPVPARTGVLAYSYSEKNPAGPHDFLSTEVSGENAMVWKGKRFRLLGLEFTNTGAKELDLRFRCRQVNKKKKFQVKVPPGITVKRYLPLTEPKDRIVEVEISPPGQTAYERRKPYIQKIELSGGPESVAWRRANEPYDLARELEREDAERRLAATRPVEITLKDDLLFAVEAQLLLLQQDGMMIYQGKTDADGRWSGHVMPGAYDVYAFAEVPDRTDYDTQTVAKQFPRLLMLRETLEADATSLALAPERVVMTSVFDVDQRAIGPQDIWITPTDLVEAYRFEQVSREIGARARVESHRENPDGRFLILTSEGLGGEVTAVSEVDGQCLLMLRATLTPKDETLTMTFDPDKLARVVMDPASGAGPGEKAWVHLLSLDGLRETIEFSTEGLYTAYLTPGSYRTEISLRLEGGSAVDFIPYRLVAKAKEITDLTIRAPFDCPLYWKRNGKQVSFWLAVIDASGRILREPQPGGRIQGAWRDTMYIDRKLTDFRFEYGEGFERVDLAKIEYRATIPFGRQVLEAIPHLERTTVYNDAAQSADAPGCFGDRVLQILPEMQRHINGCYQILGLPESIRQLHLEFPIFLTPGIGGLVDGTRINMDIRVLHHFTGPSDLFPYPYRHELGHIIGFGHDATMMLGTAAIDETRFGPFGYRLLYAREFQRTLEYLEQDRRESGGPWVPGKGVFAGLRLLFGPDVHYEMLQERKVSAQTMNLHGLSGIEILAALYSIVVEKNVAWVFRAHGWPVTDGRVDLGLRAVNEIKDHPIPLNYARLEGTTFPSWWFYGPVRSQGEPSNWRKVSWPSRFIRLNESRPPSQETQHYMLFRRVKAPRDLQARLVCAADVALEIRLNGATIGLQDPSPPFEQPLHDEVVLQQKRAYFVPLYKGSNVLEIAVTQPPGTRGLTVEFLDGDGKPLRLTLDDDGPEVPDLVTKTQKVGVRSPVHNGSFENWPESEAVPAGWLQGPIIPRGTMNVSFDDKIVAEGKRSLKFELPVATRGAVIQRLVVDPAKTYKFSARIRTEGLVGEAFVSLFNNDIDVQFGKTEPIRTAHNDWQEYEARYMSGITQVIYIMCYAKGTKGTVWFDDVRMVEVK